MHFIGALAPIRTVKFKAGVVNKTTKASVGMSRHWLDIQESFNYYTHVLLRMSCAGSNAHHIGSLSATFPFPHDSQDC